MHTVMVVAGGLVLLALFLAAGYVLRQPGGITMATAAKYFIPVWFVAAAVNMYIGVTQAGYTVMQELPIFLVIFAIPAAAALVARAMLARD